jgi:hypothetical protein
LPPVEAWLARYVLFPLATARLKRPEAMAMVPRLGQQILAACQQMPPAQQMERRLIARFPGIEDSSRFWSLAMTMQHLYITGDAMANITQRLAQGQTVADVVRIEDVKPPEQLEPAEVAARYAQFLSGYAARMEALATASHWKTHRHMHPWFGAITAHQWLCLNGLHHQIHLKQVQQILLQL